MSTKLQFVIGMNDADLDNPESVSKRFKPLLICLDALVQINQVALQEGKENGTPLPRLYDSGVVYREEPPGKEDWCDYRTVLSQGWGDCEDLASALIAERREYDGVDARPKIRVKFISRDQLLRIGYPKKFIPRDGIFLVHVLCELPDWTIEDPSAELGMKGDY